MARVLVGHWRLLGATLVLHEGAALCVATAHWEIADAWGNAFDGGQTDVLLGRRRRDCGQESLGVGVAHGVKERRGRRLLDHFAGVHDTDAVGPLGNDAHIVSNEQDAHFEFSAKIVEDVENLSLNGDVEGSGRFVGNQELGLTDESHGDHHSLTETAG